MAFRVGEIESYKHEKYGFGLDTKKVARELRKLADDFENGGVSRDYGPLQEVTVNESVNHDDYSTTTVTFRFASVKKAVKPDGDGS